MSEGFTMTDIRLSTQSKIELCKYILHVLSTAKHDPRQPDAVAHYRQQLAELEAKLATENKPIIIGLKPATLEGKV